MRTESRLTPGVRIADVLAGTGCCACIGGSTIYVMMADTMAGPWTYAGAQTKEMAWRWNRQGLVISLVPSAA